MNIFEIHMNIRGIFYSLNRKAHREEDGPSFIFNCGDKEWFQHDNRHRLDGPAIESDFGGKMWYYENNLIDCDSQEEFERIIKLLHFH